MLVWGERKRLWSWLHPLHVAQNYHLVSMDARLSSTGISHHDLLPHIPLIHLSTVNSSPSPGIAPNPQTPAPSHCAFQGTLIPVQGMYGCSKDCLILILFRLPQITCFTLSLKCLSSDSDNCPDVGIRPLLQLPHLLRAGPVLLTLLFFCLVPLSCRVLHRSIYSFSLVTYSCPLSAGVLHALLSEGVFLLYPWREMYSMSTYSSAILFFCLCFLICCLGIITFLP